MYIVCLFAFCFATITRNRGFHLIQEVVNVPLVSLYRMAYHFGERAPLAPPNTQIAPWASITCALSGLFLELVFLEYVILIHLWSSVPWPYWVRIPLRAILQPNARSKF